MMNSISQPITETLEKNYLPYAMSVILSRAIPEIDGFKPSHRKILYTMYKMGLLKGPKTKSANIVGQTMKLNPHGDDAIYATLVRMTKGNESLLYPLIDSKGNFGKVYSRDVTYAASRYTEAKLMTICDYLFDEIEKDTVDFEPNYDGTLYEPSLLPVKIPTILMNPNKGIAVGMASNITSFHAGELIDATIALIKKPKSDLLEYIKGPDLPTGGSIIYDEEVFRRMMEDGSGSFRIRAKFNYLKKENIIEITEIPYTTTVEAIVEKTVSLIKDGKIKEISDIRDESDLKGLRIAIDLKRGTDPDRLMERLYKETPLEDTFGCNFNILVNAAPMQLGVRDILLHWIDFRSSCIRRGIRFDLNKYREKLHLIRGLKQILLDIDRVIALIRTTEKERDVVPNLMREFVLDEVQAEFVANIRLRNINREYIENRISEESELEAKVKELEEIYNSEQKIRQSIISELKLIRKDLDQPRRSEIISAPEIYFEETPEMAEPDSFTLFRTRDGYLKAVNSSHLEKFPDQRLKDGDEILERLHIDTSYSILFFTNQRNVYKLQADQLEFNKSSELGTYLANKLETQPGEEILLMVATKDYSGHMIFGYEQGKIARVPLQVYETKTRRKLLINAYFEGDKLISVLYIPKDQDLLIFRFSKQKEYVLLLNSTLIPEKTTKTTQGVQVIKKTGGAILTAIDQISEPAKGLEKYRIRKIPASGISRNPMEG